MLEQLAHLSSGHDRLKPMFEQAPGFMALLGGPDHKIVLANRAFRDLVGNRELVGKQLIDAIPYHRKPREARMRGPHARRPRDLDGGLVIDRERAQEELRRVAPVEGPSPVSA
jgi:PAS domain-containing protein